MPIALRCLSGSALLALLICSALYGVSEIPTGGTFVTSFSYFAQAGIIPR